jgi:ATP-binding cassette subfamily F protein 3
MLTVNHLDIQYGSKHLFKDVSVRINPADRIGLVGVNGAGKSTLLKIMAGIIEFDGNTVVRAKRCSFAYLPQEASALASGLTIYQEAETAFAEAMVFQKELDDIHQRLSRLDPSSAECADLLRIQEDLQHRLERTDIYRVQSDIEKVLVGLGFRQADFDMDSSALSGGWLMRLQLAKLLLARPSLLMLDEPTNHLDLDSLTWLENFLTTYEGALIIISHDRAFLDNTTTTTWELSLGSLTVYNGNYSKYVVEKEQRQQVERAAYANQQAQIRQTMRFVQRFRAKSTKARQVQSRLRQLGRMERIELSDVEQNVSFRFPPAASCGRLLIEAEGLAKSYDGRQVFADLSFQLQRGEKLAVVGVNGAGKSTLMKMIAGLTQVEAGRIRFGHNVQLSYFGQHQAQELEPTFTVLETLSHVAGNMTITEIRSLLGAFLFRGDEVEKKVAILSGGEKSRLALAKMIVRPANLLILDEPTNHLDMSSQDILQEAMVQYDGGIIIVSHNRYFVNRFVNKVLEIKQGKGSLFEGNIDDYRLKIQELMLEIRPAAAGRQQKNSQELVADINPVAEKTRGREARREQARIRREKSRRQAPIKEETARIEEEIDLLETRKKELEAKMADPDLYKDEAAFAECGREYGTIERRLGRRYFKWEELQARLEEIEAEFQ